VGQPALDHARQFLRTHHVSYYGTDIRNYERRMNAAGLQAGDCSSHCMWWLPNLETAPGVNLMTQLGTKRTRGPQEMPALAIHLAKSSLVQVVGVGANDQPRLLEGMSQEELMGPPPTKGTPRSNMR
jgi:hypothetical protein